MSEALYLDTARLGLMSPSAQRHQAAFARLAGDPHSLLYFREFLAHGVDAGPTSWRKKLSGCEAWRGLKGLTRSIRVLTNAPNESEVLFASRSATVMGLAIQRLVDSCQRVLTVDLLWPPYRRRLTRACRQAGKSVAACSLRAVSLLEDESCDQLANRVCEAVVQHNCNGLVLPLIDHRGVSLPVDVITRRLRKTGYGPRYVVVDASQALGHVPIDLQKLGCHFLVAGTHKWVGGYHPLGVGVSMERSRAAVRELAAADPLLRLSQEAAGAVSPRHGETAAILPLLTAAGAVADLADKPIEQRQSVRQANRQRLSRLLQSAGWRPVRLRTEHHGILMARPPAVRSGIAGRIECRPFLEQGVAVTTYPNGLTRFSLPDLPFTGRDADLLLATLNDSSWSGSRIDRTGHALRPVR